MVNWGLYMAYALSFVKGDILASVISYKDMYSWSAFDVLNSINHMDAWIKSLIYMLITDEYPTGVFKLWPLMVIGIIPCD